MSDSRHGKGAGRTERNGPETRRQIIDTFSELVAEHGFELASVSMVATELGISKGTVVHHFPAKVQIMAEAHELYMERRVRELNRVLGADADPAKQLAAMIYALVRCHRDDRAATISFLREISRFPFGGDAHRLRMLRSEYAAFMSGIVRRGQDSGAFRTGDVALMVMQVFGTCNYLWTWYRPDDGVTVETVAAEFAATTLRGLSADPTSAPERDALLAGFAAMGPLLEPAYPAEA